MNHYALQVHGEVTNSEVDIFDREKVFIETILEPLVQRLPQLKVVMEHITTADAVKFVESCKEGNRINFLEELIHHCVVFNFKIILMICYVCKVT